MNESIEQEMKNVIKIHIGTKSVTDSNTFLRKLWGVLDQQQKNAWEFFPYTNTNKKIVEFGRNNIGAFSFDYIEKGCIDNLYISGYTIDKEKLIGLVKSAISLDKSEEYYVALHFTQIDTDSKIAYQCHNNVMIYSKEQDTIVCFKMRAFSDLDFKFWLYQKTRAIQLVLFLYTKIRFKILKTEYCSNGDFFETELSDYNYEWFDTDECPKNEANECCLPLDFFRIINSISNSSFYDEFISAVVNASHMLSNAYNMYLLCISRSDLEMERTGIFDIVNTVIVSSLEAILSAKPSPSKRCTECGQPVYSISKRVYELVNSYLGSDIADIVKKTTYNNRSKYLHEGKTVTPLYYFGSCFPLINPKNPRSVMFAETPVEYNLIDYCMYIIRKYICDYYKENSEMQ